jgi:uncharacterized protein YqfA (UPF0365 family)
MEDGGTWIAIVVIAVLVVIALIILYNIVTWFANHPFISGLLIGTGVGIGGSFGYMRIREWYREHVHID